MLLFEPCSEKVWEQITDSLNGQREDKFKFKAYYGSICARLIQCLPQLEEEPASSIA